MVEHAAAVVAVLVLSVVTLMTRFGGVWIMSYVAITPRVEAFLKYMAASVLISIVVPATLAGAPRIWLAVAASVITMVATGSGLGAVLAGTALAALLRLAF
jgi:uncharacterized membrane protein